MICPTCQQDFWALFVCDDKVYRCRACMMRQPKLVPFREPIVNPPGLSRPYITRYSKSDALRESRESVAKSRRARNLCIKCGQKAEEYTPGNFSAQCVAHNREAAAVQRKRRSGK